MGMDKFFVFNNPVKGLEVNERRFVLPVRDRVLRSVRVGQGAFCVDDQRQILPVGGGSMFEAKRTG